jgi:hypothetical protein
MKNTQRIVISVFLLAALAVSSPPAAFGKAVVGDTGPQRQTGMEPGDKLATISTAMNTAKIIEQMKQLIDNLNAHFGALYGNKKYDDKEARQGDQFVADMLDRSNRDNKVATDFKNNNQPDRTQREAVQLAVMGAYNVDSAAQLNKGAPQKIAQGYIGTMYTNERSASGTPEQVIKIITAACKAGCLSKEEGKLWGESIGQSCQGGENEGAFTNPTVMQAKKNGIKMGAKEKDTQCIMSHVALVSFGVGMNDVRGSDRGKEAANIQRNFVQMAYKARAANVGSSVLAGMTDSFTYSDQDAKSNGQYDSLKKVAKEKGVDCMEQGRTPSRDCLRRMVAAACNRMAEHTVSERNSNGAATAKQNSDYFGCMQNSKSRIAAAPPHDTEIIEKGLTQVITYLESNEFKTYLATHDVKKFAREYAEQIPSLLNKIDGEYQVYLASLDLPDFNPVIYAGNMTANQQYFAELKKTNPRLAEKLLAGKTMEVAQAELRAEHQQAEYRAKRGPSLAELFSPAKVIGNQLMAKGLPVIEPVEVAATHAPAMQAVPVAATVTPLPDFDPAK